MAVGVRQRFKEGEKKPTRYFSSRQEKTVANDLGGRQTPNSGATPFVPGDVRVSNLILVECKTKMEPSKSIAIKKEWLEKIKQEAMFSGEPYCCLAFNFGPGEKNYYIIDDSLFIDFLEYLKTKPRDE